MTENGRQQRDIAQSGLGGSDDHAMDGEILRKVIHIRSASGSGTALTIEVDAKQYVLTAAHLVDTVANGTLEVQEARDAWRPVRVAVVGTTDPALDVAVLAAEEQLTPAIDIRLGTNTVEFGQSVRMLGYPYDLDIGHLPSFRNSPLPMVRSGILSSFSTFDSHPRILQLLIDTHGNPGFSGGPVILRRPKRENTFETEWTVVGVVTGRVMEQLAVTSPSGARVGTAAVDAGIVRATSIDAALALIRARPIGYQLPVQ